MTETDKALLAVVDAIRNYLPPDGITADECLTRIIEATDNTHITPHILVLEEQTL